jgi:hypothetical protein
VKYKKRGTFINAPFWIFGISFAHLALFETQFEIFAHEVFFDYFLILHTLFPEIEVAFCKVL